MHVFQSVIELPLVPNKPVPELVLPKCSMSHPEMIDSVSGYFLEFLQDLRNRKRKLRPDQGVPVVRHQHVSAEKKSQSRSHNFEKFNEQILLERLEGALLWKKIGGNEKHSIGGSQSVEIGHGGSLLGEGLMDPGTRECSKQRVRIGASLTEIDEGLGKLFGFGKIGQEFCGNEKPPNPKGRCSGLPRLSLPLHFQVGTPALVASPIGSEWARPRNFT